MKKIILPIFALIFSVSLFAQQTAGTLTVTFSTSSTNTYSLAVYITNSTGSLVNTMLYRTSNGDSSAKDMSTFWSLIGSSWSTSSAKLLTNTDLDATSGATTSTGYAAKNLYWGKNTSIATVADGTYTVNFEMANYTGSVSRRYTSGTFTKGLTDQTVTIPNATGFIAMTLKWAHLSLAAVDNVESDKLYSVYPNPAISSIFVSGMDINQVDICSLNGQRILTSNQQKVDVSALAKGNYLAVIYTKTGTIVKKIQKL